MLRQKPITVFSYDKDTDDRNGDLFCHVHLLGKPARRGGRDHDVDMVGAADVFLENHKKRKDLFALKVSRRCSGDPGVKCLKIEILAEEG
jgi:hypothetical protein